MVRSTRYDGFCFLLPKRKRKLDPSRHAACGDLIEAIQRDYPDITLGEINDFLDSV